MILATLPEHPLSEADTVELIAGHFVDEAQPQSIVNDDLIECQYLMEGDQGQDLACAVGVLIPRDLYQDDDDARKFIQDLEGDIETVSPSLDRQLGFNFRDATRCSIDLLKALQCVHDGDHQFYDPDRKVEYFDVKMDQAVFGPSRFNDRLAQVCRSYGVDYRRRRFSEEAA